VPAIRDDLCSIGKAEVEAWAWSESRVRDVDDELRYLLEFLTRAQEFVGALAEDGRGMVYMIG
jgi:hypothetical protein